MADEAKYALYPFYLMVILCPSLSSGSCIDYNSLTRSQIMRSRRGIGNLMKLHQGEFVSVIRSFVVFLD